jgi:hypothetical protein
VMLVWLTLVVIGLLGATRYGPTLDKYFKSVPPFTEPSLFALAYLPWALVAACFAVPRRRLAVVIATAVLGLALQNLTLLLGALLVASVCLRLRVLVPGALALALVVLAFGGDYYVDRLVIADGDEPNLSTLVYLQGWQLAIDAWGRTSGFGLGFQQLGLSGESDALASQLILAIKGEHMNLLDGGFVAAKLLAEFGAPGGLLVLAFLILAVRSLTLLRRFAMQSGSSRMSYPEVVAHGFVAGFLIDMFIRGTGYLTPSMLMLLTGLFMLLASRPAPRSTGVADGEHDVAFGEYPGPLQSR